MEDGEESFEISEGDSKAEEESEVSKDDSFEVDSNVKITPNIILPFGDAIRDSNGSPGIEQHRGEAEEEGGEEEEGEEFHGFPLEVPLVKQNSGYEDGVKDGDSVQGEGLSPWPETYEEDLSKSGATDDLMPAELTPDCTHPLMCLSDIASTLRPNLLPSEDRSDPDRTEQNSLPGEDGSDPERMDVDLNESGQELSQVALSESGSAFDPSSPSEERTHVSSILHKEESSEADNSESFSESRLSKAGENEDFSVLEKVERTICKDIFRVDQNEWNELSAEERLSQNGESISSDSIPDSNQHDYNPSGVSRSPVNRLSDVENKPFNNSTSKQICDSDQTFVHDDKGGNGMCVESELQNLPSEPGIEVLPSETVVDESSDEVPSGVCDKAPQDEAISAEVLSDNKSSAPTVRENQCNGDVDYHEDSNQENVEWCDDINMVDDTEDRLDIVEDSSESLEGKRKQTFDNVESERDSLPGSLESVSPTKMLKVDHIVAQTSQDTQSTVDRSASSAPSVSQPLDGGAFFPSNQANSQSSNYSQYLGLQPTVKFKCVRCGERSFSSMMDLKTHQYACLKSHVPSQPNPSLAPLPSQTSSTNFRITRKVYLCSVCGTYYENWNLFLHMREVHKRHICLFCLGMFSRAERLSAHLMAKHNIVDGHYGNMEEFRLSCKGSVFLMCCTCEKVFSEEDSLSDHPCKDKGALAKPSNNALVSAKNPTSTPSTPFPEKKQTSKQSAEVVGRPAKSSETKAGKAGASARPKHILKVKIPILPKKPDAPPAKAAKPAHPPAPRQPIEKNGFEAIQPGLTEAHLDAISESLFRSEELGVPSQPLDPNLMSNLERTINAVARGTTSEALEWQQRKNEEVEEYQGAEEPAPLSSLDEVPKSDSDSDGPPSPLNFEPEETIDDASLPAVESPAEPVPEVPVEVQPEPPLSPVLPELEPPRSEPEPTEELPPVEDVPPEQPEPEWEPEVAAPSPPRTPSPLPAEEPVEEKAPSPAEPEPAVPERTPEESDVESDDSDKLSLVVDEAASGAENEEKFVPEELSAPVDPEPEAPIETPVPMEVQPSEEPLQVESPEKFPDIPLAGEDVPITEVTIEEPLEEIAVQALLKECVKTLGYVCVYCSHARRIAVNGKQLALHTLAEHRFSPIDGSDKQDPPPTSRFTLKLRESVHTLQDIFFNTDTYDNSDKSTCLPYDRTYECFHCHFFTRSHKELYIHNRKMHQKTILLCIMCKSNFYSYSELLCHLCPGIYIPQVNVEFHCCMCDVDKLPSAFRLMVHLRKKHHACDVCLEITGDQQKLSSHVWKHKLHHLCYRCGIAYRNKPDITNHLFWKHGTESVLCKKCLQKKWPHVYHFCVPPATFTCEECSSLFTRAVSLRVHKRIHTGETPHPCAECEEKFISKKLLAKHTLIHRTPVPEEKPEEPMDLITEDSPKDPPKDETENAVKVEDIKDEASDAEKERESDKERKSKKKKHKEKEEQKKKVVDVYDLPPLNLSSESDSSDDEAKKEAPVQAAPAVTEPAPAVQEPVEEPQPTQVLGIWDNFTNFQKNLEKRDADAAPKNPTPEPQEDPNEALFKIVMMDHDYCAPIDPNNPPPEPVPPAEPEAPEKEEEEEKSKTPVPEEPKEPDTVTAVAENPAVTPTHSRDDSKSLVSSESPSKKKRSPKKKTRRKSSSSSSGSSSGSDSSSCSCGTNCSCSSSSSSDSSSSSSDSDSSSSEGRRRAQVRRELRKERALEKKKEEEAAAAAPTEEPHIDVMEAEPAFRESDLDTTETDTDEDFYDERPQKPPDESQVEKRNLMLLASVAPLNGSTSPTPLQLDVQAALQQELNAQLSAGKKAKKKRKKKQAHYHSKLTLPTTHQVTTPVLNVADSMQAADRFPPYYAQSAASPVPPSVQRHPLTPSFQQSTPDLNSKKPLVTKLTREVLHNPGSGSETEGRTKRKRMPNKFYGYSSDEETEDHSSTQKWRKTEVTIAHTTPPPLPPVAPPVPRPPAVSPLTLKRTVPSALPPITPITLQLTKRTIKTDSDSEESKRVTSSSSSTDSDDDAMQISEPPEHANSTLTGDAPVRESNDNLYCYCQCPYDEVSEMIACDGSNCAIEWFHFECVGIMVPPKGQWYCPDCRKNMTGYQGIE